MIKIYEIQYCRNLLVTFDSGVQLSRWVLKISSMIREIIDRDDDENYQDPTEFSKLRPTGTTVTGIISILWE